MDTIIQSTNGILLAERKDKVIRRDGDCVIKIFDANYSKSNVLNEAINQSRVEETGLSIPKIREVTLIDGKWAIVMDYIDGNTLETLMSENPSKLAEYMRLFVSIQRDVHSRKHMLLTKYVDKMTMKILNSSLDASTRYDLSIKLGDMPRGSNVCHGDFNPSNIIIGKNGLPYILDWSHASQGNCIADVAKTYLLFRLGDEDRAAEYLEEYCSASGASRHEVFRWLPLVAAAQILKANSATRVKLTYFIDGRE